MEVKKDLKPNRIIVTKAAGNLPQSTQGALFTVSGGKILVHHIVGEVTTVIQGGANNTRLISNPTVGADVDLCAVVDIDADAAGTMYSITGTLANAMVATTSGAFAAQVTPIAVSAGTIDLHCAASKTGQTKWTMIYEPLDAAASVA